MTSFRPTLLGHRHMCSAGHYLATQAGHAILEGGGNAVDAGVGAALCLAVVQSDLVNFGGVAPIMIRDGQTGESVTISGVGRWPQAADIDHLIAEHGGHVPRGILRSVIPAAPDAHLTALERFGSMSFAEVAAPAIRAAGEGFVMYPLMAANLADDADSLRDWASNAAIYLPSGRPPAVGEVFVQADLARTMQHMADEERAAAARGGRLAGLAAARAAFYQGDIARTIADYSAAEGGWITRADLAGFRVGVEPPITVRFRDLCVQVCGAWCQGPLLAQILRALDGIDLVSLGHNSVDYVHCLTEIIKLACLDRERHLGDPDFVSVPLDRLLSSGHAQAMRARLRMDRAIPHEELWGTAAAAGREAAPALDTSYCCTVDSAGLVFSCTPSDGCAGGPVIPGLGLCASPRGSQSWAVQGHPASVAPGKRPRLTPNPAIAVRDDGHVIPFGTPGADVQCQAMAQVLINLTVFAMTPQAAVEAPRFASYSFPESFEPHGIRPDLLRMEARFPEADRDALAARGHRVEPWEGLAWRAGAVCLIEADPATGILAGAADPRRNCYALGR